MDFDGLTLLIDRDWERFDEWFNRSESLSLEELKTGYDQWKKHYIETREKYRDLKDDNTIKNASLQSAQLCYFYTLANFAFYALSAYTKKLKEEYDLLKKSKSARKKRKRQAKIKL